MITEDYVSFKTAKLLKEKGFDEQLCHFYTEEGLPVVYKTEKGVVWANNSKSEHAITQPTQQMAMKWLREVHNIAICICAYYSTNPYELNYRNNKPYWKIGIMNHISSRYYDSFNTYEEACEAAIKYCLENLI